MNNSIKKTITLKDFGSFFSAATSHTLECTVESTCVTIAEMEDVLFHLNSAVLMPEAPSGKSSEQGTEDDATDTDDLVIQAQQEAMTGLRACALILKEFELDDRNHCILAGHTDTSGTAAFNYPLSEQRAVSVQCLLDGDKTRWGENCFTRQRTEDYQQIMKYFFTRRGWNCDPGKLDNVWGDNTSGATERFLLQAVPAEADGLYAQIRSDGQKRWPARAWEIVYDLYSEVIMQTLGTDPAGLQAYRNRVQFVDSLKPLVACGESFPIDDAEKDSYRSQENRRVEVYLFKEANSIMLNCPPDTSRTHTEAECPLRCNNEFITRDYLDPDDLHAVVYHLKFEYYDRIKKEKCPVPGGMRLHAYKEDGTAVPSRQFVVENVYCIVVQFASEAEATANENSIYFTLENQSYWVFTENDTATPVLVEEVSDAVWNSLPAADRDGKVCFSGMTPLQKCHYYDLPHNWNSRNWFARVVADIQEFSRLNQTRTQRSSPITVNLDDIVLVYNNRSQNVSDRNSVHSGAHPHGQPCPLSDRSRVRILHIDPDSNALQIFKTDTTGSLQAQHDSSIIRFSVTASGTTVNYLIYPPGATRAVVFCGELYDVTGKRSVAGDSDFSFDEGHVLGARIAVLNDTDVHHQEQFEYNSATQLVHNFNIGHFDLHYLHGGGFDADHLYSYQIVYWSTFVGKDTAPTVGGTGNRTPATDAEVNEFRSVGMENCMTHWNKKEYQFEDHTGTASIIIKPLFVFEAFEEFSFTPAAPVNFKTDFATILASGEMNTARQNSRGGKPHSITFVTEENKGSWMRSWRSGANSFSVMSCRIRTRQDDPTRFTGFPFNEFGDPGQYGCLAMAHEIGHATGQVDDYTERIPKTGDFGRMPNCAQFGFTAAGQRVRQDNTLLGQRIQSSEGYAVHHDRYTMMIQNGPIRMRHVWRFCHWLNTLGATGNALHPFLNGTLFEVNYPRATMRYFRTVEQQRDPWRYDINAILHAAADRPIGAFLYKVLDETRRTQIAGTDIDFRSILTLRIFYSVTFVNGASNWTNPLRRNWNNSLLNHFLDHSLIYGRFYLTGGGGALDPTIIRVLPGCFINESGGAVANAGNYHYHLRVTRGSNAAISQSGSTLDVGDQRSTRELFNYFFNKPAGDATMAVTDLNFVRDWFRQPTIGNSATYRIETI